MKKCDAESELKHEMHKRYSLKLAFFDADSQQVTPRILFLYLVPKAVQSVVISAYENGKALWRS